MARKRGLVERGDDSGRKTCLSLGSDEDQNHDDDFLQDAKHDRDRYLKEVEADRKAEGEAQKANRKYRRTGMLKKRKVTPKEDNDQFEKLRARLALKASQARSIQHSSISTLRQSKNGKSSIDGNFGNASKSEEEDSNASEDDQDISSFTGKGVQCRRDPHVDTQSTDSESEEELVLLSMPQQLTQSKAAVGPKRNPKSTSVVRELPSTSSEEEIIDLGSVPKTKAAAKPSCSSSAKVNPSSYVHAKMSDTHSSGISVPARRLATGGKEEWQASRSIASLPPPKYVGDQLSSSDEDLISLTLPPRHSDQSSRKRLLSSPTEAGSTSLPLGAPPFPLPQEKAEGRTSDEANVVQFEGAFRPAFSLTDQNKATGPLILDNSVQVPAPINRFLRDYQRQGVKFFYDNYKRGQGGLLGDDMGLGKTIQVIAFLSAIMKKQGTESADENRRIKSVRAGRVSTQGQTSTRSWPTCLIVCPNSVQTNWQNELDTWGYFEHELLSEDSLKDFQRGRLDILITSHQKAKLWIDKLNAQHWSVVFVDECHTLKNPQSGLTMALNSLQCSSRFGLTGTAIQNRLEEFWTLLDWCNPGEYGSLRHWQHVVAEPIRRGQSAMATVVELANARLIAEKLKEHLLPTCFLRRTKELIKAQLPNKRDNIVFCPLTPLQITLYKKILDEPQVLLIRLAKEPCECGEVDEDGLPYMRCRCCYATDEEGRPWNSHMLKYITLLQRCSNHLALVFPDPHDNIALTETSSLADQMRKSRFLRQTEIVQQIFPDTWQTKTNNKTNGFRAEYCGKWQVLRRLMQEWKGKGDKVLLFSMNLRLLDWLAYFVEMEGYNHLRLDGGTPQKKRQPLVDQFNQDSNIFLFLISTTAGGTGLNLTGANKVVVFDPHWNPAHDLQAMDRAYRFGQTRDVDVYRLIGKGSLEETIYDRQLYKQQMGRIGYDASEERRYFQPDDAKGFPKLFELNDKATSNVTKDIIQSCDLTEATFALQHFIKDAEVDQIKLKEFKADWDEALCSAQRGLLDSSSSKAAAATTTARAGDAARSQDSIARVLQMSGIEYTHVNDDLLGGSTVESMISKQAKATIASSIKQEKKELVKSTVRRPNLESSTNSSMAVWPPRRTTTKLSQT
ncbi:hypothetical protein CBS101457_003180 [Exobasidium rhododendri]|nr:hypothetical protein CBS101457_003180 [Exobasidium rhododendri]